MTLSAPSRRLAFLWGRVLVWCALIFALSAMPDYSGRARTYDNLEDILHLVSRKAAHMLEYGLLMVFVFRAVQNTFPRRARSHFLLSFAFILLYAASDEWHQTFVFGRTGMIYDVLFDALGALVACAILQWLRPTESA